MELKVIKKKYLLWKKKNILKLINKEIDVFEYSVEKNLETLNEILEENIELNLLEKIESELEKEEKKVFYILEDEIVEYDEFLEFMKILSEENYEFNKQKYLEFLKSNEDYSELNKETIINVLMQDYIKEYFDERKMIDIYEIPISAKNKILITDYEKKIIKRI